MKDEFLKLFESAKTLMTYIDEKNVFDKAAAGGCSGMDYHLSDDFYDLIVNTRKAISDVENGLSESDTDSEVENGMNTPDPDNENREGYPKLFEAVKALTIHIDREHAFDKVNDMGPVGIETYQSEAFIEVVQNTNKAIKEAETSIEH